MSVGRVVFSLDFELGWGHRRTRPEYVDRLRSHGDALQGRITELIELFERYDVPATWAVVGRLLEAGDDPLFHAPALFETLLESGPDHEIGVHSFAHEPYDQLSTAEARDDLGAAVDELQDWNCRPSAFVFPQNRIAHLGLLNEFDIRCYRMGKGESSGMFSELFTPTTVASSGTETPPVGIPSSMFLAARRPSWYRRRYALRGVSSAVEQDRLVHYWLHPHNVVTDDALLEEVEMLLERVSSAVDEGTVQTRTLSAVARDWLG